MPRFLVFIILGLLFGGAVVNLVGAFGPEMGFDALWYHLTLPKLYWQAGEIYPVSGGLLYYSTIPRLTEIIYYALIPFSGYVGPHLVQWLCGLLTAAVTYLLARQYVSRSYALLAAAIFYLTPLVGWQSGSAYVDLVRSLWEVLAFYFLLKRKPWSSGIFMGLALSTKMLALGSLPILGLIFWQRKDFKGLVKFFLVATLVASPWYIYNFLIRGNPIYPMASGVLDSNHTALPQLLQPWSLVLDFWKVFMAPEDFISPAFILILPLVVITAKKLWQKYPELVIYVVGSYIIWWIIPRLGGGRYLLPYLPVWATLVVVTLSLTKEKFWQYSFSIALTICCLINLLFRVGATARLLPVLLGKETAEHYVCRHLDSMPGTFLDCDNWWRDNLKKGEVVYVQGVHNLFYLNFPFVHESWYQGEKIDYILLQGPGVPRFGGELIHQNSQSDTRVYKL